jgi:uroporphyrinogen-III synthase
LAPLAGFVVGVTAGRRAEEQAALLERRGARVLLGPVMATSYLASDERLRRATDELLAVPPRFLVLTSGIGVRAWFEAAQSWGVEEELLAALTAARVLARGPKAAAAARAAGLQVAWSAPDERMADVYAALEVEAVDGARVAVQCYGQRDPELGRRLAARQATVIEVQPYRWEAPADDGPARRLVEATVEGRVHAVTFTSAPATERLAWLADDMGAGQELRHALGSSQVVVACMGPVCSEAAEANLGVVDSVAPSVGRLGLLVRLLTERLQAMRREVRVGEVTALFQGDVVAVGGRAVQLTPLDAALTRALLARPGAVVSRRELARTVWQRPTDEHTVEAAVARLRQRLGPLGRAVETAPRRGYRLAVEESG